MRILPPILRRLLPPVAVLVFSTMQTAAGGCSSSSELYGDGGCDAFCTKWTGAGCRNGPKREECLASCKQDKVWCADATNMLHRCALLEANIACETGSGAPRIVGCAPREADWTYCRECVSFCTDIVATGCADAPDMTDCMAACTDPRCSAAYQRYVDCERASPICSNGSVLYPNDCFIERVRECSLAHGQPELFHPLPPAGSDVPDAAFDATAEDGFAVDTFTSGGGL